VTKVRIRDHIFAVSVHIGIIICIGILVLVTSCGKPEPPAGEPDPVADFFREMQSSFDEITAETVIVIGVLDNAGVGNDISRQVFQEIQTQLNKLGGVTILEQPAARLESIFREQEIDPKEGISSEKAMELGKALQVDAMILASVESDAPDVHIKIYATSTGAVIFAETLQEWPLPVTETADPLMDELLGGESEEPAKDDGTDSGADKGTDDNGTDNGQ